MNQEIKTTCPRCAAEQAEAAQREAEVRNAEEHRRARARRYREGRLAVAVLGAGFRQLPNANGGAAQALATVAATPSSSPPSPNAAPACCCAGDRARENHLAVALAKTLLDEGHEVRFSGVRPLLREIRETWVIARNAKAQ